MSEQRPLKQEYEGQTLDHVIVHDGSGRVLPTVIIIPTVMGVQPLELGFAERLVALGYHVVVADLFGRRFTPASTRRPLSPRWASCARTGPRCAIGCWPSSTRSASASMSTRAGSP